MRHVLRLLGAALLTAGIGAVGLACPARELVVQITPDGTSTMALACESFRDACQGALSCTRNALLCKEDDQGHCTLRNACDLDNGAEWAPLEVMAMQLLLVEVGDDGFTLQQKSPCIPLNLRPCVRDPTMIAGCPDGAADTNACLTEALATAVSRALGSGLSYSGFHDRDEGVLGAVFFQKPGHETSCDSSVLVGPGDCSAENLVAAAGFAAPLGETTFDLTCASCKGGPHASVGRDNGPCPVIGDKCFLQGVAALLNRTKPEEG